MYEHPSLCTFASVVIFKLIHLEALKHQKQTREKEVVRAKYSVHPPWLIKRLSCRLQNGRLGNKTETDNQRYIEQITTAKSRRKNTNARQKLQLQKRQLVARLTKVLYLANIKNKLFHTTVPFAGLIPRKYKLLPDFKFNTNYCGSQFHAPSKRIQIPLL